MERIDKNILVLTENLGSNNSMIMTSKGIVLIDSPHKLTDALKWKREIESRGKVIYLLNTDHHPDHTMGNYFLDGEIIAHENTREKLANEFFDAESLKELLSVLDPEGLRYLPNYSMRLPTITITDRVTLYLNEVTLQILHKKGHTPNNLMVYIPEQKVLFTGDNFCEAGLPSFQETCVSELLKTIREIMEMDIRFFVPGHGKVSTKVQVNKYYNQVKELIGQVDGEIQRGTSKEEIVNLIRFEDNIHVSTSKYQGYPSEMIELFQKRSISRIYDELIEASA